MLSSKRKFDYQPSREGERTNKKPRPENGSPSHGGHSQGNAPPELPPISPMYELAVFTHASVAPQDPSSTTMTNYERLEFLGDAHIEHIATLAIFERYQASTPGKMSSIREALVRNEVLSKFCRLYGFDKKLKIALGSVQPREWTKIHGDIFEAYVAAVVLSHQNYHTGFETARDWLTKLWEPTFATFGLAMAPKDIKSKEMLGKTVLLKGAKLNYIDEKKPIQIKAKGSQLYFIGVYYDGLGYENQYLGSGQGESKNVAGQEAARNALQNPLLEEIKAKRAALLEDRERQEKMGISDPSGA